MLLDFIIIMTIIGFGFKVKAFFSIPQKFSKVLNFLWLYQFLFSIIYYLYISANGGDAWGYWHRPRAMSTEDILSLINLGSGTRFMYVFNYIPSNLLNLDFLTGSIIYGFVGYIGFVFWFKIFIKYIHYHSYIGRFKLFPLIFFLPNLHFWSSGVGKDTILFTCIALFVYSIHSPKSNLLKLFIAFLFSYLLRPHITLFLVSAAGVAFLIEGRLRVYQKVGITIVFAFVFILLFDKIMTFLRIEDLDTTTLQNFADTKVGNLSGSNVGSSVDTSGYSLPLKVFTFLFRPLFYDAQGLLALLSSFENLFLIVLTIKFIKSVTLRSLKTSPYLVKTCLIFFLMGSISFSLILGNLGIMLRQKNMFIPCLLFLSLYALSYKHEVSTELSKN